MVITLHVTVGPQNPSIPQVSALDGTMNTEILINYQDEGATQSMTISLPFTSVYRNNANHVPLSQSEQTAAGNII